MTVKGRLAFPLKSVFLQLVMKVHREQRFSVGVPNGRAHSSGTEIPRPGPARALPPEGWFSVCSSLRSLSEFIVTSELLDFHCCSSAIGKENAERPGKIASF